MSLFNQGAFIRFPLLTPSPSNLHYLLAVRVIPTSLPSLEDLAIMSHALSTDTSNHIPHRMGRLGSGLTNRRL